MGSLQADVAGEEDCERHGGVEVAAGEVAGREGHDCDGEPELQTDRHRRGLVMGQTCQHSFLTVSTRVFRCCGTRLAQVCTHAYAHAHVVIKILLCGF